MIDRIGQMLNEVRALAAPPPPLTVDEWSDRYAYLPPESSAEPGKMSTSRFPWQKEPMMMVSDPNVNEIVLLWGSQLGKSQLLLCTLGFFVHWEPAPILYLLPSSLDAEKNSIERISPFLNSTPALKQVIAKARSRSSENTILHKRFPGGFLALSGCNSSSHLRRRPIRVLLADEIDDATENVNEQGDPIQLAIKRTETFSNAVVMLASTPTLKGSSRIEAAYAETDCRQWHVPCHKCATRQQLAIEMLKWNDGDLAGAWMECQHCQAKWSDGDRIRAVMAGSWVATKPFCGRVGYFLSGLNRLIGLKRGKKSYLQEFAEAVITSKKSDYNHRVFVNTFLALGYEQQTEAIEPITLASRGESYTPDALPANCLLLSAGVDVQGDRLECELRAWSLGEESWGVSYETFRGDPQQTACWEKMRDWLVRPRKRVDGVPLSVSCVGLDTGFATHSVYAFVQRHGIKGCACYAIKGAGGFGKPLVSAPRKSSVKKVRLYVTGTDTAKALVYSRLGMKEAGPGFYHFPIEQGFDKNYFNALTCEVCVSKWSRGRTVKTFENQKRMANEALDCAVLNLAAISILRPDFEKLGAKLLRKKDEAKGGPPPSLEPTTPGQESTPAPSQPQPEKKRRRSRRNAWMGAL